MKCLAAVAKVARKAQRLQSAKKPTKPKMSESSRMSRQRAIRNSVRVNARRVANRASRVNPVNRALLASRANHVRSVRCAEWIEATAARRRVKIVARVISTAVVTVAANAAVALIVETVVIAVNVRRCASERRWIATVDRAMTVEALAVALALPIVIVDRVMQIVIVADAATTVDRASMTALAKAIADLVTMIALPPVAVAVVNVIMTVRRNANVSRAIAIVIILRAVNRCAIILRVAVIRAAVAVVADAKRQKTIQEADFGPPFLLSRFGRLPGEKESACGNNIFAQRRERHGRNRMKSVHDKIRKSRRNRRAKRFANK